MTHTSPFMCVRCSEPALFFGLHRISGTGKLYGLHFFKLQIPPVRFTTAEGA
ncbi:hypothetical protein Hanom_Chr13g01206851 [Helianthus anomalus]